MATAATETNPPAYGTGLPPTVTPSGIEALVCADIARRQKLGIMKYGQTVADNPLPLRAWLQHGYEEALDLAVYLRRSMAEIDGEAAPLAPTAGRAEASQAISRLLDAQVEEIKKLRERTAELAAECHRLTAREAELDAIVQDMAVALELLRSICEHAEARTDQTHTGMSVGIRTLARHSRHIKDFGGDGYWQRVRDLAAKGGA